MDGANFLFHIAQNGRFFDFYPPRIHVMWLTQVPAVVALRAGVVELETLARLLSLGMFALPTAAYHLALWRARDDAGLVFLGVAVIALDFMHMSFFIVGEYNAAYALAVVAAVVAARAARPGLGDGVLLLVVGAVALRSYETMVYLGLLTAAFLVWRVRAGRIVWTVGAVAWLGAAILFLGAAWVGFDSMRNPYQPSHFHKSLREAFNFWQNLPFALTVVAFATVAVAGVRRPESLCAPATYRAAWVLLALVASSALLCFTDWFVQPLPKSHYAARTAGGFVAALAIGAMWCHAAGWRPLMALAALRDPLSTARLSRLAVIAVMAAIPVDIALTMGWTRYLDELRSLAMSRSGPIPFEETRLGEPAFARYVENWTLPLSSALVRPPGGTAVVLVPKHYTDWQPFDPLTAIDRLRHFHWRR